MPDPETAERVTFDQEDITTLIAALEALSVSEYASEYARIVPLLRRLKAQQNDGEACRHPGLLEDDTCIDCGEAFGDELIDGSIASPKMETNDNPD